MDVVATRRPVRRLPRTTSRRRRRLVQGDLRDRAFVGRAVGRSTAVRLRLPPGRVRRRGAVALHPALTTTRTTSSARVHLINAGREGQDVRCFVFTSSIAVYGRNQMPMTEDLTPAAGGPVRHLQVRRRAGPAGRPRDVRPRLRRLPAAQRLRRAPEHRRPLSQRHRHLHEPAAAAASR